MRIIKLNKQIKKRFIFLLIIFVCFSSSIFLISYSLKDQIAYFVEPTDLKNMNELEKIISPAVIMIAVFIGKIRLIDNIFLIPK